MFGRQYHTLKTSPSLTKRDLFKQNFQIHHPLLEQMIEAKLQKCMKYGQVRQKMNTPKRINRVENVNIVEAPFIAGNQKKIEYRTHRFRKSVHQLQTAKEQARPKTTNTVIRSRTSEPRLRQRLQYLEKDDDCLQENLRPTLNIRRYQDIKG